MPVSYVRKSPPTPLPSTLGSGQLTTIAENPYVLSGEARLVGDLYYGEWRRAEGKASTFVAARLVDWDQWRSEREVAEGLLAKNLIEAINPLGSSMLLTEKQAREAEEDPGKPLGKALY